MALSGLFKDKRGEAPYLWSSKVSFGVEKDRERKTEC